MTRATSSTCDDADRRLATVVERQRLAGRREPAELVDHRLGLGAVVLHRARPVDDPEPQDREVEAAALGRTCRGTARRRSSTGAPGRAAARTGGRRRPRRSARARRRSASWRRRAAGTPAAATASATRRGAGHVRLLRVVGVALGDRPAGLGGEQVDAVGPLAPAGASRSCAVADVGGLDARALALELGELARARSAYQLSASVTSSSCSSAQLGERGAHVARRRGSAKRARRSAHQP